MSFSLNHSKSNRDYISFLDGGSKVPYYQDEAKYFPIPKNIEKILNYDNKIYYKKSHSYYVGIVLSDFVRLITAQDFHYIENEIKKIKEQKKQDKKIQLAFNI